MKEALFIDRDGVINRMVKYNSGFDSPQTPRDVKLVDGIIEVIRWANEKGILTVEISNQPGVAKGKMSLQTSKQIEAKVHKLLAEQEVYIDHSYICQHHPQGVVPELSIDCDCRKPNPGLILNAIKDLDINLSTSLFIGDKASDAQSGEAAGVKTIIFIHEEDEPEKVTTAKKSRSDFKTDSMNEVLRIVNDYFVIN